MRTKFVMIGTLLALPATIAGAQTPAEDLKDTWVAQSVFCEQSIVVVTAVEVSGIVRGTFTCKRINWTATMGETKDKNAVRGTLVGTRFRMENADGGGFDLTLSGKKLDGSGSARSGLTGGQNPVTYLKQ